MRKGTVSSSIPQPMLLSAMYKRTGMFRLSYTVHPIAPCMPIYDAWGTILQDDTIIKWFQYDSVQTTCYMMLQDIEIPRFQTVCGEVNHAFEF